MCHWQKCIDAERAERDAEDAWGRLTDLRAAVEDHRRGILDDLDIYARLDEERIEMAQTWNRR